MLFGKILLPLYRTMNINVIMYKNHVIMKEIHELQDLQFVHDLHNLFFV